MKRQITVLLISAVILISQPISAGERHIHVNGQCLESSDMERLDQLIGGAAPDGYYWIDFNSGAWGYEGSEETQGYIASIPRGQTEQSDSLSEERRPYMESSITGRVVSGLVNGQDCTYVSVGGATLRSCD